MRSVEIIHVLLLCAFTFLLNGNKTDNGTNMFLKKLMMFNVLISNTITQYYKNTYFRNEHLMQHVMIKK